MTLMLSNNLGFVAGDFVASPRDQIQHAQRGSHQTSDNLSFRTQFERQQHKHPQHCLASGKGRKHHFRATTDQFSFSIGAEEYKYKNIILIYFN